MNTEKPGTDPGEPSGEPRGTPGRDRLRRLLWWLVVVLVLVGTLELGRRAWSGYQKRFLRGWTETPQTRSRMDFEDLLPGLLLRERKPGELAVVFLDVGQGDAIFILTPGGKTVLIDAGSGGSRRFGEVFSPEAGRRVVYPFLLRNRIDVLDYIVGTHSHGDHVGGVSFLLGALEVRQVWLAGSDHPTPSRQRLRRRIQSKRSSASLRLRTPRTAGGTLRAGQRLRLGPGVKAWLLRTNARAESANGASLVLLLHYGRTSFLFPGDLEESGERALIRRWGDQLDVDVLKVAHHGSSTSTTREFLQFVKPHYSVVSVGRFNSFGHPTEAVLKRLERIGSRVLRTDRQGTIYFFSDGRSLRVTSDRSVGLGDPWPVAR